MDLPSPSDNPSPETDLFPYTRWQDVFRSWFWRYYDNLFKLILCNLGWFFCCFGTTWLASLSGLWNRDASWYWAGIAVVYVLESALTFLWALPIFQIMVEGHFSWESYKSRIFRYFPKGIFAVILVGLFLGLAFFNLRFYFTLQSSSPIWVFVLAGFVVTLLVYGIMMTFYLWPILFFQNPPVGKLFYRAFMVTLGSGPSSLLILFFSTFWVLLFTLIPFLWFALGFGFLFALYCSALEKHFLRYRITLQGRTLETILQEIEAERKRGWRDILKPWETR